VLMVRTCADGMHSTARAGRREQVPGTVYFLPQRGCGGCKADASGKK
jgi:hypothetical protein